MATAKERHPHVYIQKDQDPRQRKRTVPMEVLSLGYSRTGTMTMKAALEILGYPTWHFVTMAENPPDLALWREAMQAKFSPSTSPLPAFTRPDFDNLLGSWSACTDSPAAQFAEELVTAYQDAKCILVVRDEGSWYRSFCNTVIEGSANWTIPLVETIDRVFVGQMAAQADIIARYKFGVLSPRRTGWASLKNNPAFFEEWRGKAREGYRRHNELVRRVVPKERLLEFNLQDGWGPLCSFLGKEVPECAFPRVNETKAVLELVECYIAEGYRRSAVRFVKKAAPMFGAVVSLGVMLWVRWMGWVDF